MTGPSPDDWVMRTLVDGMVELENIRGPGKFMLHVDKVQKLVDALRPDRVAEVFSDKACVAVHMQCFLVEQDVTKNLRFLN